MKFEDEHGREEFERFSDEYLCDVEMQMMIGFTPFNEYFSKNKRKFRPLPEDSLNYPTKLFIIID